MKTATEIIIELNKISLFEKVTSESDARVADVFRFYEQYPQYSELRANDIYFILRSIKISGKAVRVHKFNTDQSIWFVGHLMADNNAPISSIGGEWAIPKGNTMSWHEGLAVFSEQIGQVTWNY